MKSNKNPIIYKQKNGSYFVIDWFRGEAIKQVYYGYSKKDCLRYFKKYFEAKTDFIIKINE
jgi:hypothetical protein